MTVETYYYVFMGAGLAAFLMLVLSIVLYFKLKIPKAFADLTGRARRKALLEIQKHGLSSEVFVSSELVPVSTTAKITPSGNLISVPEPKMVSVQPITEKLITEEILIQSTDVTTFLDNEQITVSKATTILNNEQFTLPQATTILTNQPIEQEKLFEIEYDITFVQSEGVIV